MLCIPIIYEASFSKHWSTLASGSRRGIHEALSHTNDLKRKGSSGVENCGHMGMGTASYMIGVLGARAGERESNMSRNTYP
jgi:hypothetical protein